jgi:hypothetical protein
VLLTNVADSNSVNYLTTSVTLLLEAHLSSTYTVCICMYCMTNIAKKVIASVQFAVVQEVVRVHT